LRVVTVIGNRPQFVKAAAVSRALRAEHDVRRLARQQRPDLRQHPRRLLRVRPAGDVQLVLRARHLQLLEEDRAQLIIMMLPRVHDDLVVPLAQQP